MHNKPKQMIIHHVTQVLPSIADMAKLRPLDLLIVSLHFLRIKNDPIFCLKTK